MGKSFAILTKTILALRTFWKNLYFYPNFLMTVVSAWSIIMHLEYTEGLYPHWEKWWEKGVLFSKIRNLFLKMSHFFLKSANYSLIWEKKSFWKKKFLIFEKKTDFFQNVLTIFCSAVDHRIMKTTHMTHQNTKKLGFTKIITDVVSRAIMASNTLLL